MYSWFWICYFKFLILNFWVWILGFGISEFEFLILKFWFWISILNLLFWISDFKFVFFNFWLWLFDSNFWFSIFWLWIWYLLNFGFWKFWLWILGFGFKGISIYFEVFRNFVWLAIWDFLHQIGANFEFLTKTGLVSDLF